MSNLPLKDKDFYDGSGNPVKDVSKSIEILNKLLDDTIQKLIIIGQKKIESLKSNPKDTSKDYQDASKGIDELTKSTEALIQIKKEKERLDIAAIKYANAEQLANEKLKIENQKQKKAVQDLAKESKGLIDGYDKLVKSTNAAQKEFKRLAVEFGLNSKQAKAAKVEFEKLDGQLRKVNTAAKDGHRDVGRYAISWDGIKGSLMGAVTALGITGGIAGAMSIAKGVMESTEGTADKFRETVSGLGGALGFMARSLANMDFSNLIQGMKDAYAEGVRYEKGLDLSKDLKRSLDIQMLIIDGEQSALKKIAKIKSNEIGIRTKAIDDIISKEEERLKRTKVFTEQQLDNELTNAAKITKASKESILELISNRDKYIGKIEEGATIEQKINDEATEYRVNERTGLYIKTVNLEKQKKLLSELSDEQRYLIELNQLDLKLVGDKRDKVAEALKQNIAADNALIFKEESLARLKNSLYNELIKEEKATNELTDTQKEQVISLINLKEQVIKLTEEKIKLNEADTEGKKTKQKEIDLLNEQISAIERLQKLQGKTPGAVKVNEQEEETGLKSGDVNIQGIYDESLAANDAYLQQRYKNNQDEIDAEKAKIAALKGINEGGYTSILDIFSKFTQKKIAIDKNYSAEEIAEQKSNFEGKVGATVELVNTLKDIYTDLLESRIDDLQSEIDATNQKIDETEQALNRETALAEAGAASNVQIEKQKLERLQAERDKDLQEQKKLQKEKEKVDKLNQISSLITAIANIIAEYSDMGPVGWVLGLLAAGAAVVGYISTSNDASSAVGEDGLVLTNKGTHLEGGKRHSQGGNKYSMAEFEQGEAHSIFSREATQRNFKDIEQFTDLVNSGKWDLYKNSMGNSMTNLVVNNDYEQMLKEQRTTNHLLRSKLTPFINKKGNLVYVNYNGVAIKGEN